MGARVRALDWSKTSLGPIDVWPVHLRATISLMLPARAQIVLFWGPEFVAIYNDSYAPTIGMKHPSAFGRAARENWAELWDDLEPLLRRVLDTGETVFAKDRAFYIERHGYPENVHFDISYSPVRDEAGNVEGRFCAGASAERCWTIRRLTAFRCQPRKSSETGCLPTMNSHEWSLRPGRSEVHTVVLSNCWH